MLQLTLAGLLIAALFTPAALPPGEPAAKAALESSPRHGEWVDIPLKPDQPPLRAYVVYPQVAAKAPVVVVIHEIFGLTDWIRSVADQLAADGFIAIAPDLLSGPLGPGTESFASRDDVTRSVRGLSAEQVAFALDSVRAYGAALPAATDRSAVVGFCWGGTVAFNYAIHAPTLNAAVTYYGTNPADPAALAKINAPLLGLYGENDARVNTTIPPAQTALQQADKDYTVHIYPGAGHGFLRQQQGQNGANQTASEKAWVETLTFLRKHLQ